MDELLKKLQEKREAAAKAFAEFATPLLAESRDLTEDEETKRTELRSEVQRFDARIAELSEDVAAEKAQAEARAAIMGTADVAVKSEPKTYDDHSPNSYFADLVRASGQMWNGHSEAVARLAKHSHEMAVDAQSDTKRRETVSKQLRAANRTNDGQHARSSLADMLESRAMDTTAGSGGSFVTPVYMEQDYAPYRHFGRVFIDQTNKHPLPEYGMTVFLPVVQSPAGVAVQGTQGQGVLETDPTAGYLSANLTTEAGQVTISQQLLDRAGPNFQFDKLVFDQLQRDYNYVINQAVITAALAGAGTITNNTSTVTISQFYGDMAHAKSTTVNTAGTILPATHLFTTPTMWEWLASRTDTNSHPLIVPQANGPYNAIAASPGTSIVEGFTGSRVLGLDAFEDGGVPLKSANQQVIVAHMPEVWVFEGDVVPRVIPQTYAQNLQVLLQIYAYYAVIVRYPLAVQTVTGSAYPGTPTF
jgi:hypothetical protein